MSGRRQLRWWKPGGLRWPWLARLTNGRIGLGRWTQAEVDQIQAKARVDAQQWLEMFPEEPA